MKILEADRWNEERRLNHPLQIPSLTAPTALVLAIPKKYKYFLKHIALKDREYHFQPKIISK